MAEIDRRKAALIAEIEISRLEIRSATRRVERSADLMERARRSMGRHIGSWLIGGLTSGFLLSVLIARKNASPDATVEPSIPKTRQEPKSNSLISSSLVLSVAKFAFEFARPKLVDWINTKLSERINSMRVARPQQNDPSSR